MKKKKIFYFLLIIFFMIIIFFFSNQNNNSSDNISKGLIKKFLLLFNVNDKELINTLNYPIRKLAHFTFFFLLGFSFVSFFKELNMSKYIIISVVICLIYACFDEFHQIFINGRTAKIFDVFIDMSGVLFAIFLKKCIISKSKRGESHEKR